jgi:hypothetical protein
MVTWREAAKVGAQAFEFKCGSTGAIAMESGDRAHDVTRRAVGSCIDNPLYLVFSFSMCVTVRFSYWYK